MVCVCGVCVCVVCVWGGAKFKVLKRQSFNLNVYIYMHSDEGNKHCMIRIPVADNRLTPPSFSNAISRLFKVSFKLTNYCLNYFRN